MGALWSMAFNLCIISGQSKEFAFGRLFLFVCQIHQKIDYLRIFAFKIFKDITKMINLLQQQHFN